MLSGHGERNRTFEMGMEVFFGYSVMLCVRITRETFHRREEVE